MTTTGATGANTTPNDAVKTTKPSDPLADKNTFLQLLVAQLQHQDPISPADGLQFITQLAQFTSLEQSIGMRDELTKIRELLTSQQSSSTDAPQKDSVKETA